MSKAWKKGEFISNMKDFPFTAIGVEFWDIKSVTVKKPRKGVFL